LEQAEKKRDARAAEFEGALERARAAKSRVEAQPALEDAERLAGTEHERLLVQRLTTMWNSRGNEVPDAAHEEEQYQRRFSETTDAPDRLEDAFASDPAGPGVREHLGVAEQRIADLKQLSTRVKPSLARHAESAAARLARIHKDLTYMRKRADLLDE